MTPSCKICASDDFDIVSEFDRPDIYEQAVGISTDGYWRHWVRCRDCGFHSSHYSRDPEILDRIYEKKYREKALPRRGATTEDIFHKIVSLPPEQSETIPRVNWIKSSIDELASAEIINWDKAPFRLLDIGGATGVFAHAFQDEQWRSHVVDPAKDGLFIEDVLNIPFKQSAYKPGLFSSGFHLISLIFVLEHLRFPDEIVAAALSDTVPSGLFYVEVPDYVAFQLKPADDDIFNSCHLWMFDPNNLIRLLARNGLEVMRLSRVKTVRGHYSLAALASPT